MPKADILIELQGGDEANGLRRYEPGSRLEGLVRVTPSESLNCRRVLARVGWYTSGAGARDQATFREQTLLEGPLTAAISQPLAVELPQEPWTFTGQLIRIDWEVRVVIDFPLATDIEAVQLFVMAPRP